ncbi:stress response protein SCP2 [Kitasatospora sp. GAS204A]|uniref:TerD family protein n=1 Tax=unclassified Kitasatospora TaxID=2633591 RepID=UPI00247471BF|nr:TerD family protein [Kitasatospora sp. GAS204B]MDH6118621.1 stress response protein SCP2 [Kitasatospora sp. GAS204B]
MTHVMAKGANISLATAAVRAVLRWSTTPGAPDVDASALLLGADGKVRSDTDFVFYNQPRHPTGTVRHRPKYRVPGTAEIADTVEVDLGKLPAEVHRVVLAGSAEEGDFRAVGALRVLLYDAAAPAEGEPLAEFPVGEVEAVSALVCAEFYRREGGWKFRAVGQGYASGLSGLATDFGVTVEDETPGAPKDGEPANYALAPAAPIAPPAMPPAAPPTASASAPNIPPVPATPPTPPPPAGPPGYGYPPQAAPAAAAAPGYGYPQQPPPYGYPPQAAPGYGYPQQPPSYGYPPQAAPPAPPTPTTPPLDPTFALPPQGPQFQPR